MSVTPSSGRRGTFPLDSTSAKRPEAIQRLWSFLSGLATKTLRVYGESATTGHMLVASDVDGNVTFSNALPSTTVVPSDTLARTGEVIVVGVDYTSTLTAAASGEYEVTLYLEITTASAGTGILYVGLTYTDDIGAVTIYPLAGLPGSATGRDRAVTVVRLASSTLDFTIGTVGTGTPTYSLFMTSRKVR